MAAEGQFPKVDTDILYASEVNAFNTGVTTRAFSAHDNTGGVTISAATVVNLDTEDINEGSVFTLTSDEITIADTRVYIFNYRVSCSLATGTRNGFSAWLTKNGSVVDGTLSYAYGRVVGTPLGTAAGTIAISVTSGDTFKLNTDISTGTVTTVADASGITIFSV